MTLFKLFGGKEVAALRDEVTMLKAEVERQRRLAVTERAVAADHVRRLTAERDRLASDLVVMHETEAMAAKATEERDEALRDSAHAGVTIDALRAHLVELRTEVATLRRHRDLRTKALRRKIVARVSTKTLDALRLFAGETPMTLNRRQKAAREALAELENV